MAIDHALSREHAMTPASSGRPSDERVTGHQEGSRGLISPSRRMCSTAPVRGFILLVPTRFTEVHISSPACACGQKDHLEGTKVAVFPSPLRPKRKTSPAAQRSGGHRRVATRKTTGGYLATTGTDPETRAEWTTVSLRPPPVCTGRGGRLFTHGAGTAYAPCSPVFFSTRPAWAPPRWPLASPATYVTRQVQKVARDAEMRRRVCEVKRASSGSDVSAGS